MDLFPEDKDLVATCTFSLSSIILFNRANGLRAGRLGCLNHTLHVYMQNMDNQNIMGLGGAIGAYFDYVDENRLIARELGGIQAIIQNIRNHFHGKHGEWTYNPVKQSLYALSSGCWLNQDICVQEGFPELAVRLMAEHADGDKIAEETLQVTRALMSKSDVYRQRLAALGMADAMVTVMQANPHDRGALDLTCVNFVLMVDGTSGRALQAKALEAGALEAVLKVVMPGQEMSHKEHSAFNFDVDAAYNVNRDCFSALAHLGYENPAALERMGKAGMVDVLAADLDRNPPDGEERSSGCWLLKNLGLGGAKRAAGLRACAQ